MAENDPIPPVGGVPPKPAEAAKVQPKKETVRITLPPKPTAAPTVRLPSMAPGAPAAAAPAPSAAAPAPAAATATAPTLPMRPAAAAAPAAVTAPAQRPGQTAAPMRQPAPAAAVVRPATNVVDLSLAIAAAVVGALVLVRVILLANLPS
jgi:hypothetical protein